MQLNSTAVGATRGVTGRSESIASGRKCKPQRSPGNKDCRQDQLLVEALHLFFSFSIEGSSEMPTCAETSIDVKGNSPPVERSKTEARKTTDQVPEKNWGRER
jgi:hypothetical protein